MEDPNDKIVKRLDALLGIVLARTSDESESSLAQQVTYLRNLGFSNKEMAPILGKTVHHIEVEASKLVKLGKIRKMKGK